MDINNRDEMFEKKEKELKHLKESYKGIFKNAAKDLLTEGGYANMDGKALGKKLKAGNKPDEHKPVHQLEEDAADGDPKPEEKPEGEGDPKVADKMDANPTGPVGDKAPGELPPPPPLDANAPEGGEMNSQDQMNTRTFVGTFLKTLPSDIDLNNSVDANGVFKASINDQHNGQFMVVAFPATKTIHQVADLVEPQPGAAAGLSPDGSMPPAPVANEVPPVEGEPLPGAAGMPPVAPATAGAPPMPPIEGSASPAPTEVEEPVVKEEGMMDDHKCMDPHCTDPSCPEHGMAAHAMKESEHEKQRDPMIAGRKNWNSYLAKLLKEGVEAKEANKKKLLEEAEAQKMEEEKKKWEQEAVKHPGAFEAYCKKAGFDGVCDECIAHAKKSDDAHVVKMATLAQTFRKQAHKMEESVATGESVEKLEKRVKNIEEQLKDETDAEEKEKLKIDLGKAKMALARAKDTSHVVSDADKKKIADEK